MQEDVCHSPRVLKGVLAMRRLIMSLLVTSALAGQAQAQPGTSEADAGRRLELAAAAPAGQSGLQVQRPTFNLGLNYAF